MSIAESIRLRKAEKKLIVKFKDGSEYSLAAELLRVETPSAEVQGHSNSEKFIVSGRRHVGIIDVEPVGNYAVRLKFDDLHDSGIYTWGYLYKLGRNKWKLSRAYLGALKSKGLSRDP